MRIDGKKNILSLAEGLKGLRLPDLRFTVSGRDVRPEFDILTYVKFFYIYIDFTQIESVFGSTVFPCPLYGGRDYNPLRSLTEDHIFKLEEQGIGLSITLTNHFFNEEHYRLSRPFLERLHKKGNSIIAVNDKLAHQVRHDFPLYTLKASMIKNLNTTDKVRQGLEIYDYVVVPMEKNDDDAFLDSLTDKNRIYLFGNAGCAYNCPSRDCYMGISQKNAGKADTRYCSRGRIPRPDLGALFFDVAKLASMGFRHFKLLPNGLPMSAQAVRSFYHEDISGR
jgi:hypothetical protein